MNSKARVLVVSRDEMLLRTREMILGGYFNVHGAGRFSEAKALISATPFDLVVLCHSLQEDECEQLAQLVHSQVARGMVLAMDAATNDAVARPWADRQLGVDAGPFGLLKTCVSMFGLVLKSKAKAAPRMTSLEPMTRA
jgi:DNA-binding NtrC family response regulator